MNLIIQEAYDAYENYLIKLNRFIKTDPRGLTRHEIRKAIRELKVAYRLVGYNPNNVCLRWWKFMHYQFLHEDD
jgi:hypothetical protein